MLTLHQLKQLKDKLGEDLAEFFAKTHGVEEEETDHAAELHQPQQMGSRR